jgi:hypothetical protein
MVFVIATTCHQSSSHTPINQAHGTVVAQQEVIGDLAHGGAAWIPVSSDRQEQLVLGGGQAGPSGLLLAPPLEAPQGCP